MPHLIYVEEDIRDHPLTERILARHDKATVIPCERYGELFNRKAQNFRLQKQRPALILARKHRGLVLDAPAEYSVGGQRNYYFSHMLNCLYDCRYCFLQGMYRSANHVVFVNYEDFARAIGYKTNETPQQDCWFFSGYDCDSLAFEAVTGFLDHFLPLFRKLPRAWLELRTKSTQISTLLGSAPLSNCVIAYSFTPALISQTLEYGVPSLQKRLDAMRRLHAQGWKLGLRFDPLIYCDNYQQAYGELFREIFTRLPVQALHSVSLGAMRLPKTFFQNMQKLYPDEKLFAGPLAERNGLIAYRPELEQGMMDFCTRELMKYIPEDIFYPCIKPDDTND